MIGTLERQGETRVQELLPIRYARMAASPFAFFRGSAAIMAGDLAETPRWGSPRSSAATPTLSTSAASPPPDRELVFDLNDFDETFPARGSGI